jgi:RNA polymerase sigma factor (sigma-70 family)
MLRVGRRRAARAAGWGAGVGEDDAARGLDWAEIYDRLAADRGDELAWVGMASWVGLWARHGRWRIADLGDEAVEDAVAETCAMAVARFEKARGAETFVGFVYGHFLNVRQRLLRDEKAPVVLIDFKVPDLPDELVEPPAPDELALLHACLDGLAPRERRAVELRYYQDAPAARIAAALGVTVGNARRIVFNGLARLRACFERAWPGGRRVQ